MKEAKTARKFIETEPHHPDASILSSLLVALESDTDFRLGRLYDMELKQFELALELMRQWRLDRHYLGGVQLPGISMFVHQGEGGNAAAD